MRMNAIEVVGVGNKVFRFEVCEDGAKRAVAVLRKSDGGRLWLLHGEMTPEEMAVAVTDVAAHIYGRDKKGRVNATGSMVWEVGQLIQQVGNW